MESTNLQAQQNTKYEELQVELVNETTKVEKEYNAKLEATKERLAEWTSIVGRELVGQWDDGWAREWSGA